MLERERHVRSIRSQLGSHWVGLDNFKRFFTDPRSVQIFWNTLRFTALAVTGNVSVGLLLALALNRAMPGWLLYFFRLAFFLPVIIAAAFVAIVWGYFFQDSGIFNYYLAHLGLPTVRWLTSAQNAMPSIVFMDVWKNTGFFMIIFIAALQGVPRNITEAAVMDGTPAWRQFFRITLPYISPVVFFCIVYASIGALQVYESIVILTQGGPGDATRSLSILIVEQDITRALAIADRFYCLLEGRVNLAGRPAEVSRETVVQHYFGV